MSTGRLIKSHRIASTGIHSHRCPLDGATIDYQPCLTCEYGGPDVILHQTASYKVSCGVAIESAHLMATEDASKAYNPDSLPNKLPLTLAKNTYGWVDLKLDGARAIIQINSPGPNLCVGRRKDSSGAKRQWEDNVPHFKDFLFPADLHQTVLDTEVIMQKRNWVGGTAPTGTLGATMKVMGSSPAKAIAVQEEQGYACFYVFDILWYKGEDVRDLPFIERQALANHVVLRMMRAGFDYAYLMQGFECSNAQAVDAFLVSALADGHEGLVLKKTTAKYMDRYAMIKLKESYNWDVLVTGIEMGKKGGKYAEQIGAFKVSVLHSLTKELVEIGKVPPGCNVVRREYSDLLCTLTEAEIVDHRIILAVKFQNVTKETRMRHACLLRFRPDRSEPEVVDFSTLVRK